MEPLVALGLASNIIQIADFSGRMISRSKEIYTSASGTLSVYTDLEDAARNLQELSRGLADRAPISNGSRKADKEAGKARLKAEKSEKTTQIKFLGRAARRASYLGSEKDDQSIGRIGNNGTSLPTLAAGKDKFVNGKGKRAGGKDEKAKWVQKRAGEEQRQGVDAETKAAMQTKEEIERLKRKAEAMKEAEKEKNRLAAIEKQKKRRAAEKQLVDLSEETKRVTDNMISAIQKLKSEGSKTKFQSMHQAFRSIWSEPQLKAMEQSLDNIRKQTDTALLFSVREQLDELREYPSTGVEGQIFKFIKDFDMKHHELLDVLSSSTLTHNLEARDIELRKTAGSSSSVPSDSIDGLADKVDSLVQTQLVSRFKLIVDARLKFVDMRDRFERIPQTHEDTFSWIYRRPQDHPENGKWNDFAEWLGTTDAARLYWVTGKPGSGKSTLMKYLYDNTMTMEALRPWAYGSKVFHAGYFFWNSGTPMQMSREGLLKTLLIELTRQILESKTDPHVLERIFADRWSQFVAFGGGRSPFTWSELRRSFQTLISDTSKLFFLVIDGLDEFDGDPAEIIEFVLQIAKCPNVKICTASRPWPVFEDAFHKRPSLLLEDLTRKDIRDYVTSKFDENRHYARLVRHKEQEATALVADIIDKASGVFLWVYLVVDALLHGISNADTMSELQVTLDALPADLEDLFDRLLVKVEPKYHRQACEMIRLVDYQISPSLLELSYADDNDIHSGISAKVQALTSGEVGDRVENMKRRLKSRCKGFLEVYVHVGEDYEPDYSYGERLRVGFLHRTARDYFRSDRIGIKLLEATRDPPFNPCERWANAYLWSLKTMKARENNKMASHSSSGSLRWYVWAPLTWCMEHALRLQLQDGQVRMTYLDEVGRVGIQQLQEHWKNGRVHAPRSYRSFLELATHLGMEEYLTVKLQTTSTDEVKQLAKINTRTTNLNEWLDGRTTLLARCKRPGNITCDMTEILRYRSMSSVRRAFASKPSPKLHPCI